MAEEKHLHTVQVLREKSLGSEIQGKTISLEELPLMINCAGRRPMPLKAMQCRNKIKAQIDTNGTV